MSTVDDLMKLADEFASAYGDGGSKERRTLRAALESALAAEYERGRSAREQDAEPVAWMESPHGAIRANPLYKWTLPAQTLAWQIPLYTSPPKRKPLTVEQIDAALVSVTKEGPIWMRFTEEQRVAFARAVEQAHGIEASHKERLDAAIDAARAVKA